MVEEGMGEGQEIWPENRWLGFKSIQDIYDIIHKSDHIAPSSNSSFAWRCSKEDS
jgi:hypothetical protein